MSYLLFSNDKQTGPFSAAEIQEAVSSGRVSASDLIWKDGMAEWQPINEVIPPSPPKPEPTPGAPPQLPQRPEAEYGAKIQSIIDAYQLRLKDSYIFLRPNIPEKKLNNAIGAFAKDIIPSDALILIDNTGFGSAKDGGLLTANALYVHNMGDPPDKLELAKMTQVEFVEKFLRKAVHVNGVKFLEINFPEKPAIREFTEMLREIIAVFHPPQVAAGGAATMAGNLRQLKSLLDEGLISTEEYEIKRKEYLGLK